MLEKLLTLSPAQGANRVFDLLRCAHVHSLEAAVKHGNPRDRASDEPHFPARTRQPPHDRASRIAWNRDLVRMQKRKLGQSKLEVSALGLGCMGMSFSYGPPQGGCRVAFFQVVRK